jgi:hypothetical protein
MGQVHSNLVHDAGVDGDRQLVHSLLEGSVFEYAGEGGEGLAANSSFELMRAPLRTDHPHPPFALDIMPDGKVDRLG